MKWYWKDGSVAVDMQSDGWQKNMDLLNERLQDLDYKRVAYTKVGDTQVSTVWLGTDLNLYGGKPLIFETMVFDKDDNYIEEERYSTEAEALKGHAKLVKKYENRSRH